MEIMLVKKKKDDITECLKGAMSEYDASKDFQYVTVPDIGLEKLAGRTYLKGIGQYEAPKDTPKDSYKK